MKDSLLCIITRLLPASLQFKGLAAKYMQVQNAYSTPRYFKIVRHLTCLLVCKIMYQQQIIITTTKSAYKRIESLLARESNACIINVSNRLASSQVIFQLPRKQNTLLTSFSLQSLQLATGLSNLETSHFDKALHYGSSKSCPCSCILSTLSSTKNPRCFYKSITKCPLVPSCIVKFTIACGKKFRQPIKCTP